MTSLALTEPFSQFKHRVTGMDQLRIKLFLRTLSSRQETGKQEARVVFLVIRITVMGLHCLP
jgi:hypothetical protein